MLRELSNKSVVWYPYTGKEAVVAHFSSNEWFQIMPFVKSDEEFRHWVSGLEEHAYCWLLRNKNSGKDIAFLIFLRHHKDKKRLVMHGGAWADGGGKCFYPQAMIMLLRYMLRLGLKIHTTCDKENFRAIKFDRALGFRPYRYDLGRIYFYITLRSLEQSFLFQYINRASNSILAWSKGEELVNEVK